MVTISSRQPPPDTSFYFAGGTLPPDHLSYVERQADRDLLQLLRQGEYCYVLNSRQMGKSSLCVRAITHLLDRIDPNCRGNLLLMSEEIVKDAAI